MALFFSIFPPQQAGAYTLLFGLCMWIVLQRPRRNIFLTAAAIASYILSALYVALDLRRVALSYTVDPAMPWTITYNSNYDQGFGHILWYIFDVEVRPA